MKLVASGDGAAARRLQISRAGVGRARSLLFLACSALLPLVVSAPVAAQEADSAPADVASTARPGKRIQPRGSQQPGERRARSAHARADRAAQHQGTLSLRLVGRVLDSDGRSLDDAVVVSSVGGLAQVDETGAFQLTVSVEPGTRSLNLTAVANHSHGTMTGRRQVEISGVDSSLDIGTLILAQTGDCESDWLPTFGPVPGVDGTVTCLAVFDDGSGAALYAGGEFQWVAGETISHIARWDGAAWSAVGSGMNDPVYALAVLDEVPGPGGEALYAGGSFTVAGGVSASRIARWNGTTWSAVGTGMNGVVRDLVATNFLLYAGGEFTTAGGLVVNRIARWNGVNWLAMGTGMNDTVHALTTFASGGSIYVIAGGFFTTANGVSANRIAMWSGNANAWVPNSVPGSLGSGLSGPVYALAAHNYGFGPEVYAGGDFATAGGMLASRIAKWNGSAGWTAMGAGVNDAVYSLAIYDDGGGAALYAGGAFTTAGSVSASRIAKWNGSAWSGLGEGVNYWEDDFLSVHSLAVFDGESGAELVAGGFFTDPGWCIAKWSNASWSTLGLGLNDSVNDLAVYDDGGGKALYAAGWFTVAGGQIRNCVAKWDGDSWSALGSGIGGFPSFAKVIFALAVYDDGHGEALYAAGRFTTAGAVPAAYIAKWDGKAWSAVGSGLSDEVYDLTVHDDGGGSALYAGGAFTSAGGVLVNRIAKWNGSSWSALGTGMDSWVDALTVYDDGNGLALYAGGSFTTAGGVPLDYVAKWDGAAWSALGTGVDDWVYVLEVFDDGAGQALYAGGEFTVAGGVSANRIAKWNGTSWSALGTGMDGWVESLGSYDDGHGLSLYAGGSFFTAGGEIVYFVAKWNGADWSALGDGLNGEAHTFRVFDDGDGPALYIGGRFGDSPAGDSVIAKWGGCAVSDPPIVLASREVTVGVPAPDLDVTNVTVPGSAQEGASIQVFWRVRNDGNALAQGPWSDRLWLSPTAQFDPTAAIALSTPGGSSTFPVSSSLAAGAEALLAATVKLPSAPGTYFVVAQTNQSLALDEGGAHDNNFGAGGVPIVVTPILWPDLLPGATLAGVPPAPVQSSTPLQIGYSIANQGIGPTSSSWTDRLWLCNGPNLSGATTLAAKTSLFGLAPGASYPGQFAVNLPANISGSNYFLAVSADVHNNVAENNETNNVVFAGPFTILLQPQPDLVATWELSPLVNVTEGQILAGSLAFRWRVANAGDGPTNTGTWTESLYFSLDSAPSIGAGDVLLKNYTRSGSPLLSGQEETHPSTGTPFAVVIPPGTALPGGSQTTGWFKIRVDADGSVTELAPAPPGEANNVAVSLNSLPLSKAPLANLAAAQIAPAAPAIAGFALPIEFSVEPSGGASQGAYSLSWTDRVSLVPAAGGSPIVLGNYSQSNQPDAQGVWKGVDYDKTVTPVLAQSLPPGQYRLQLVVDVDGLVEEVSESDNEVLSAPFDVVFEPIDLAVSLDALSAPAAAAVQQEVSFSWTVSSVGPGKTPQSTWTDQVYLSLDGVTPIGSPLASRSHSGSLVSGQSYSATASGVIPSQPPGDYVLIFRTDAFDQVPDIGPANDSATMPFALSPQAADLVVSSVLSDSEAQEGQPFSLTWSVENQGSSATMVSSWTDLIWLSPDPQLGPGDLLLGAHQHGAKLAQGGSYSSSRVVDIPFGVTGVRYVIVETDGGKGVFESNQANNISARQLLMVGETALADLTVTQVGSVAAGTAGQPLQVSWTVHNAGPGTTNVSDWIDRVYLSFDTTLEPGSDVSLGFFEHDGFLAPGESIQVTRDLFVPPGVAGSPFVIVHANPLGEVHEGGSLVNTMYGGPAGPGGVLQPIEIFLPLPADLVVEGVQPVGAWEVNQPALVHYTVRNAGANAVSGQWSDMAFLSADDVIDGGDLGLGQYTVTSPTTLAPGGSFVVDRDLGVLPGVSPGAYRVLVLSDVQNQIPEPEGVDFNLGASGPLAVDLAELGLGPQAALDFPLASGQSAWFRMNPPAGATVRWTATHSAPSGWISLWGRQDELPTPGVADVAGLAPASAVQQLLVQGSPQDPATWYGLVRASTGAPPGSTVHISAELAPLALEAVAPDHAGTGVVTLRMEGTKLASVTAPQDVTLFNGSSSLAAQELHFDPATGDLFATFDLSGALLGNYSLQVEETAGIEESVLPAALAVEAPLSGLVSLRLLVPNGIKHGSTGFAQALVENAGNVDLPRAALVLALDGSLGASSGPTGMAWTFPDTPGAAPAGNGLVESTVLLSPRLMPGQSAEALVKLSVPAAFPIEQATFALTGRPLAGALLFAGRASPSASVLGRVAEALRHAVLASPETPADLLGLAIDAGAWAALSESTFAPLVPSAFSLAPQLESLGGFLDALAAGIAQALPSQQPVSAAVLAQVRGALACLTLEDLAFACEDLGATAACNPGLNSAPLLIGTALDLPVAQVCFPTPFSEDPNEKRGKPGFGAQQQVSKSDPLTYKIDFENVASAQASASFVSVEDVLESGFDPSTFELKTIAFGDVAVQVPPGNAYYFTVLDLSESFGLYVQVSAGLVFHDALDEQRFSANGVRSSGRFEGSGAAVVWNLLAIDPLTGLPPVGGEIGLLAPNEPGENDGQGSVTFSTEMGEEVVTGTQVKNRAKIKFDVQPPQQTNQVLNSADASPPGSTITGDLVSGDTSGGVGPLSLLGSYVALQWSGADDAGGSGLSSFTVSVTVDSGPWVPFLIDTTETTFDFPVEGGHIYGFRVQGRDNTGQLEAASEKPALVILVGGDCNSNGVPDDVDVSSGTSADCNYNNVPDECEPDSDGDGIIDACRPLTTDTQTLSLANGGKQSFSLQAGTANAGRKYVMLGSISGTSPGVVIAGLHVPLNWDFYLLLTARMPQSGFITGSTGFLDAEGQGQAAFVLPSSLPPSLVGLRLYHAYVLTAPLDFASNPVSAAVVP